MLTIKKAEPEHAAELFAWRNDRVTRAMFRTPQPVAWQEHARWFADALADPDRLLLVARDEQGNVGVVRFDVVQPGTAQVSINLNPRRRRQNLGARVLRDACRLAFDDPRLHQLVAEIKRENLASHHVFERVGFVRTDFDEGYDRYELHRDVFGAAATAPRGVSREGAR